MGNRSSVRQQGYPEGSPRPPSSRWRERFLIDLAGALGAGAVLIVVGLLIYPELIERLPWTLVPLLGIFVGGWVRERRVRALESDGLYPVQNRVVRSDGSTARYRSSTALAMPGYILCRRSSSEQDVEVPVRSIDEPRKGSWLGSAFVTDGPTATMRVHTADGAVDLRGRPEHLYALAAGAAQPDATPRLDQSGHRRP